ncbi:hypothetical protein ACJX0J_026100 [Zea mays]
MKGGGQDGGFGGEDYLGVGYQSLVAIFVTGSGGNLSCVEVSYLVGIKDVFCTSMMFQHWFEEAI